VHDRAAYDRETIDAVLDAGLICHLGFVHEGQPFVIPTLHARIGDQLYVHGSSAARSLRTLEQGVPVCVSQCQSANNTDQTDCMIAAKTADQATACQ